jgi:nicotinamidase-related amidase
MEVMMTTTLSNSPIHDISSTALLFVDPYNDFLAPKGKLWPMVADVAIKVGTLDNLRKATAAARRAGMQIVIVPHHRWRPGELDAWYHPSPYPAADIRSGRLGR